MGTGVKDVRKRRPGHRVCPGAASGERPKTRWGSAIPTAQGLVELPGRRDTCRTPQTGGRSGKKPPRGPSSPIPGIIFCSPRAAPTCPRRRHRKGHRVSGQLCDAGHHEPGAGLSWPAPAPGPGGSQSRGLGALRSFGKDGLPGVFRGKAGTRAPCAPGHQEDFSGMGPSPCLQDFLQDRLAKSESSPTRSPLPVGRRGLTASPVRPPRGRETLHPEH